MSQNSQNHMTPEILDGIADGVVLQHHIQHRRAFGATRANNSGVFVVPDTGSDNWQIVVVGRDSHIRTRIVCQDVEVDMDDTENGPRAHIIPVDYLGNPLADISLTLSKVVDFGLIPADCWGHVPQPFGGCPQ